jgi:hypothetical protein
MCGKDNKKSTKKEADSRRNLLPYRLLKEFASSVPDGLT